MAINAMIPMQGQVADPLNALASGYQLGNTIRQQPMVDQMNQQKLQAGEIELKDAKMKQMEAIQGMAKGSLQADYYGAVQIAPYLASGDMASVERTINQRKQAKQLIGMPTDTEDNFLKELQSNPEQAKKSVANMMAIGQQLFGQSQSGKYSAPIPAVGPDGKLVYIQGAPSGGAPNVLEGYSPPPSAADQQAVRDSRQNAALARLLAGGIGDQGGGSQSPDAPPAPNAPTGLNDPFAGMSEDEIARLPPDILKKYVESKTNPKNVQASRERQADTKRAVQSAQLFIETLQDPEIKSATGPAAILGPANRALGTQAGVIAGRLERLGNKLTLEANSLLKGATTDRDIKFLQGTMPSKYDSVEVWADWYENDYLGTIKANAEANGLDFNSYGLPSTIEANKAPIQTNQGWSIKKVQ